MRLEKERFAENACHGLLISRVLPSNNGTACRQTAVSPVGNTSGLRSSFGSGATCLSARLTALVSVGTIRGLGGRRD